MRTRAVACAALLLGVLRVGPLEAQDGVAGATRLTLEDALHLAERNNPNYRRVTNDLELNHIEQREAWLTILPMPQLSLLNTGMSWNLQRVGVDPFGNPLPNPEARMIQSSDSRQQAALRLTFDFRNFLQFRSRGANAVTRDVGVTAQLQALRTSVRRGFLDAQERQLAVELETELLETDRRTAEATQRLFALARATRIDLLGADLAVAEQEEALRVSRANLSNALLALRNAIGDPSLAPLGVEPVPLRMFDPARLDDEVVVRAALAGNPRIAQQAAAIRAAERQVVTTRSWWLPTLGLAASTGRSQAERGGGSAFLQPNPSGGWDRTISVNLNFPDVARQLQQQNTTGRQQITVRNQEEDLRRIRMEVEQEVRSALVELRSVYASMGLQERRVELAEENLELQLESYRLGRGTFRDLQNAANSAAAAQRTLLARRFGLERALVTLEQTLGMPLERIAQLGGG